MNFTALFRPAFAVALVFMSAQALAQPYTERAYNPPVGSRWSIVSVSDSADDRGPAGKRDQHVRTSAELTIEEKLADGFRISYVNRDISITGNAPGTEIASTAFGAVKDIVVRARTDKSGKPIAVENLDEVKATLRTVIDRMAKAFEQKPQVAGFIRQMMEGFLVADEKSAVTALMEDLPVLAAGQNTGLKPGEVRREQTEVANPFGGNAIKTSLVTRISEWDDKAGTVRIARKNDLDPEALKAVTLDIVRKLAAVSDGKITPEMLEMMKKISFTIDSMTLINVRDGMTGSVEDSSTTSISLMGQHMSKVEKKVVSVTPLAK
jgi:hypothetical protein